MSRTKPLLLANPSFMDHLLSALLLDADHPRAQMSEPKRQWLQTMSAECFARLAAYEPAREALERDPRVGEALQVVREKGFAEKAREFAAQALLARRSGGGVAWPAG